MNDFLLISAAVIIIAYLINFSRTTKDIEPSIRLSNAFVALACFLICFSYSTYMNLIRLPWESTHLRAFLFNFGWVAFLVGVFIMFIELLKDPLYKYSPYVAIIGMSLLMMYARVVIPFG